MVNKKIKLAIPKGSLQEPTLKVFNKANFNIDVPERGHFLKIDDPEIELYLLRPQEIPKYVEMRKLDAGISGDDWILETRADINEVCDLKYGKREIRKIRWVLAVPGGAKIKSVKDLEGKVISTEIVNIVKDYLKKHKVKAEVEFSYGATEAKPPRFADAIVDLTETGASLKAHNLKILDTVLESSTKLIASKSAFKDSWKKKKIKDLAILFKGVVEAEKQVGLMFHIPEKNLKKILKFLPKLKKPTIRKIAGENWYDVSVNCDEIETRELIPKLKRMGCQGIIEFPFNNIVF